MDRPDPRQVWEMNMRKSPHREAGSRSLMLFVFGFCALMLIGLFGGYYALQHFSAEDDSFEAVDESGRIIIPPAEEQRINATKINLSILRNSIARYHEALGVYPTSLKDLTTVPMDIEKERRPMLGKIPEERISALTDSESFVANRKEVKVFDNSGGWLYNNVTGVVSVNADSTFLPANIAEQEDPKNW